ncbi:hypothetical protein FMN38_002652 [Escherichia coli]|nr:hypothetical protein [Escherichia coli]
MSEQFLYFLQQMFNGVTLGSTYALIAIGYTMVYGIIGMINFAHGEVYMIGSYVSFMIIAALMMMGIDTGWLLVAAVAGVLLGQFYGVINPYIGFMAGMKAFTAAVLGGIGSIPGAMIGGLILGIAEALSSAYLSTEYKDVVSFALLILVLLVMPTGILGRPEVEKV